MESPHLSPTDRLAIIEDAIRKARQEKTGAAFYYILWGAVLSLFGMAGYLALSYPSAAMSRVFSFAWMLFPLGGLLSFLKTRKDDRTEKVKPLNERLYQVVWSGVGLCFATVTVFGVMRMTTTFVVPVVLLILGFASYITGGLTRFRPSLIGGAICIIFAGIAMALPLALQCLVGAVAVLIANVLPGILMIKMNSVDV